MEAAVRPVRVSRSALVTICGREMVAEGSEVGHGVLLCGWMQQKARQQNAFGDESKICKNQQLR